MPVGFAWLNPENTAQIHCLDRPASRNPRPRSRVSGSYLNLEGLLTGLRSSNLRQTRQAANSGRFATLTFPIIRGSTLIERKQNGERVLKSHSAAVSEHSD
jgi:hypothetical protein